MGKSILFIAPHRKDRSPSQRFRFEQYFQFLEKEGFSLHLSYLLSEDDDKVFYSSGNILSKVWIMIKCFFIRLVDLVRVFKYDLVFIQREAYFLGTTIFERALLLSGVKLIYDFDDAIWFFDISESNRRFSFLKNPSKTSQIISNADMVFAGNKYLADYAALFNKEVLIVPTTIDTDKYHKKEIIEKDGPLCIGWSGSLTTIVHFQYAISCLKKIKEIYGDDIYIKVIGYANYKNNDIKVVSKSWEKESEVEDLLEFDIGIMPLPADDWSKGKCGLKGLQYMALGIPTIMSPVGVNNEIIKNGYNGLLAGNEQEWIDCLRSLIDSFALRKRIGESARQTVVEKYSVDANKGLYINAINKLLD